MNAGQESESSAIQVPQTTTRTLSRKLVRMTSPLRAGKTAKLLELSHLLHMESSITRSCCSGLVPYMISGMEIAGASR
jgi:hypothetical protein